MREMQHIVAGPAWASAAWVSTSLLPTEVMKSTLTST